MKNTEIQVFLADCFTFDFKKHIKRADFIFSSFPWKTDEVWAKQIVAFFKNLHSDLKARKTLLHIGTDKLMLIEGHREPRLKFKDEKTRNKVIPWSKWNSIEPSDIWAIFTREFQNYPGKTYLEPFCGTCSQLSIASQMGMKCFGVDSSENELQIAQKICDQRNTTMRLTTPESKFTPCSSSVNDAEILITKPTRSVLSAALSLIGIDK